MTRVRVLYCARAESLWYDPLRRLSSGLCVTPGFFLPGVAYTRRLASLHCELRRSPTLEWC